MTSGPPAPQQATALPPWLQAAATSAMTSYDSMIISAPKPIRASVSKRGDIDFKAPDGIRVIPQESINGVLMAYGRPRVFWSQAGATEGLAPDCSSDDGVSGQGTHIIGIGETSLVTNNAGSIVTNTTDANIVQKRDCSTCEKAQYGSGQNNSQACKQTIRLGVYVPTHYPLTFDDAGVPTSWSTDSLAPWWSDANNEEWPDRPAPPLIMSISPSGLKDFESYLRFMMSGKVPMECYWTMIGGTTKTFGSFTVGVPTFNGSMMTADQKWYYDYAESLKKHPVVKNIKSPGSSDDYLIEA